MLPTTRHTTRRPLVVTAAVTLRAAVACVAVIANQAAAATYRTVAVSGSQAPNTPMGANFSSFESPIVDASGNAAFRASLSLGGGGVTLVDDSGIWSEGSGGTLALLAREGSQAPDTPSGAIFNSFGNPLLNSAGQTAFSGSLQVGGGGVTSTNNLGIWFEGAGTLALVARRGTQAPGAPTGANFDAFNGPVFNSAGKTAFSATLQTSGGGVASFNDSGIWSAGGGTLSLLAREGSQAPDTPDGAKFEHFFSSPVINSAGKTAFAATLQTGDGDVTIDNNTGIWSNVSGTLALVARKGSQAPGTPAGANFSIVNAPTLNSAGKIAFVASLIGTGVTAANDEGIWTDAGGALNPLVRKGEQAPGAPAGANFNGFLGPALSALGKTAFFATLQTGAGGVDASNDQGIWSNAGGTLNLLAREGSQAPGVAAGLDFTDFGTPVLNSAGKLAFTASLTGPGIHLDNDIGLWAQDPTGALTLIVREGDPFIVGPGDVRNVQTITFSTVSGAEDGRGTSFNDGYTVSFKLSFFGGTSGVFTATIPEPTGLALSLLGGLTLLRRRSSRPGLAWKESEDHWLCVNPRTGKRDGVNV